jgi:Gluconate 2-dehydrogenase subunit 3
MATFNLSKTTRRDVLNVAGVAVVSQLVPGCGAPAPPSETAFFTPQEFTLVDELTELILPADDHSPGARAAQVAAFVDQQLHESLEDDLKSQWREGLKSIDAMAREMHGAAFLEASPEQRVAVLERVAQNENAPEKPEEHFFAELKSRTAFAYYTSEIGIHQELEYKGNVAQDEFAGYDAKPVKQG